MADLYALQGRRARSTPSLSTARPAASAQEIRVCVFSWWEGSGRDQIAAWAAMLPQAAHMCVGVMQRFPKCPGVSQL